jgi:hypothetical protein
MKSIYIIIPALLVTIAVVFSIPAISVPVQRIETYTENITKQEPYTVIEKQQLNTTPHVYALVQQQYKFDNANKQMVITFWICAPGNLSEICTCRSNDTNIGTTSRGSIPVICIVDGGKIHVTWSINENDRDATQTGIACPPHFKFTNYLVGDIKPLSQYNDDKHDWQGEIDFPTHDLSWEFQIMEPYYSYLIYGYDCDPIGRMPPVNITVDYTWYSTETVDKEVTKYRDVIGQVEKQRTVTDYQKISVWQRIFNK